LRDHVDVVRVDNAFVIGDAIGLATRDLAEGIGPAIRSGYLAAHSILSGADYTLDNVSAYSTNRGLIRNALEYMMVKRNVLPRGDKMNRAITRAS